MITKDDDKLCFYDKSNEYIKYYLLWKDEKQEYQIKNWMNFITWYRWSGKSSFIDVVLQSLWDKNNWYLTKNKKLIRVQFNPRDLQDTKSIYQHFLETFVWCLLKEKYDGKLKSLSSNLLKLLDSTWNDFLSFLSKIIYTDTKSINDYLDRISERLKETYKNFLIMIVIDEIDRVDKDDLINIWKILNLIKKLVEKNQKINLICLYAADSRHLANFGLWDNDNLWWKINFYQYFNKFPDTTYDVYINSQESLLKMILWDDDRNGYWNDDTIHKQLIALYNELDSLGIPLPIRDFLQFKNLISISKEQLVMSVKKIIESTVYDWIYETNDIEEFFDEKLNENSILFLDALYLISIKSIDPVFIDRLMLIYNWLTSGSIDEQKKFIEGKWQKYSYYWKYSFDYRFNYGYWNHEISKDQFYKYLLDFIKTKFLLIKWVIDNDGWISRYYRLLDSLNVSLEKDLIKNTWIDNLGDHINKFEEKFNILFKPDHRSYVWMFSIWTIHFQQIWNNLERSWISIENKINFFNNYVKLFEKYISQIDKYNWDDFMWSDYGFVVKTLHFLYNFLGSCEWSYGIFKYENDTLTINDWQEENFDLILKDISQIIKSLNKWFNDESKKDYSFFYLFYLCRLYWYFIYQYERWKKRIFDIFKRSLWNDELDVSKFIIYYKTYLLWEFKIFRERLGNGDLIEDVNKWVCLINNKELNTEMHETLTCVEFFVYSLYCNDKKIIHVENDELLEFIETNINNDKHLFLLLCHALKTDRYDDFQLELNDLFFHETYKCIYKRVDKNLWILKCIEDFEDEIIILDSWKWKYLNEIEKEYWVKHKNMIKILEWTLKKVYDDKDKVV